MWMESMKDLLVPSSLAMVRSVSSASVDDWDWDDEDKVLTILKGDETEKYTYDELVANGLKFRNGIVAAYINGY